MFNLKQALDAVKDKPEFGVYERPFGTVIDYNVTMFETFTGPNEHILRNLRGTFFDASGKIISLAYHKFENLGQSETYMPEHFDFSAPHRIETKLDGSMIRPVMSEGKLRLATRAGVTDVAVLAEKFVETLEPFTRHAYRDFMFYCLGVGYTPIFEFCSRANRVVIDYAEPMLVLTDVRCNKSGKYVQLAVPDRVKVVGNVANENSKISELASVVKEYKDAEGVVVKFSTGKYVKIKGEEYCLRHRTLDGLRFEKDVLKMVLTGILDDVIPLVTPEVKLRLIDYNDSVLKSVSAAQCNMLVEFEVASKKASCKKEFAELVKDSAYRGGLFKMYDGKNYQLKEFALSKTGSATDVDSIRSLIGKSYYEF
jgi:T4 RnlA family RNA ligase